MKCMILGADGFMGRHLVAHLAEIAGVEVIPLGRTGCDIGDPQAIDAAVTRLVPEVVINLAGISDPQRGDIERIYRTNAFGQLNLLESAARSNRAIHVLFASSGYVYGRQSGPELAEDLPCHPLNHYALSKLLGEKFCSLYSDRLSVTVVRLFNCIGLGQRPTLVVSKIVEHVRLRKEDIHLGAIDVARDFVDVRDVCQMWQRVMVPPVRFSTVNFCNGIAVPLGVIVETACAIAGHRMEVIADPSFARANDVKFQRGDSGRIVALGYQRQFSIRDSLEWMLAG